MDDATQSTPNGLPPTIDPGRRPDGDLLVRFGGDWSVESIPPFQPVREAIEQLPGDSGAKVTFDLSSVRHWDSTLVFFVVRTLSTCEAHGVPFDLGPVPSEVRDLVDLSRAVPEEETTHHPPPKASLLSKTGNWVLRIARATANVTGFVGEIALSFARLAVGKIEFRLRDFFVIIQESGSSALPIVGLISVLTGLILAFVGAVQLRQFGAEIYVADAVGIAMAREMAALMTGIIMAGRSGAAFAAHIGSMRANEEIDALTTFGIDPVDYLVTPRAIAIAAMMPLLVLYSDLLGVLGGMAICVVMLDITPVQYWVEMKTVVDMTQISIGLVKGVVFGWIVAVCGCYHGIRSGTDAASVGRATTSAVVSAIIFIVVADAVFAVVLDALGI